MKKYKWYWKGTLQPEMVYASDENEAKNIIYLAKCVDYDDIKVEEIEGGE